MSEIILVGMAVAVGLYMAWNIGANDVANAMGTSVGSGALTLKKAIIVASVFEFLGALLVGAHVTKTISKGIVNPCYFTNAHKEFILGMLSALLSAGLWLQVATYLGLPVSTTHSVVGAVVGFGLIARGLKAVIWGKLTGVVSSWILSPIMGAFISFFLFKMVAKGILESEAPVTATKKRAPFLVFILFFILTLSFTYRGLKNFHLNLPLWMASLMALLIGMASAVLTSFFMGNYRIQPGTRIREKLRGVEEIFSYLQIMTACYMAFAHGANDVANATGPLAGVVTSLKVCAVRASVTVPIWVLFLGGFGIVLGLSTWGYRVIDTVGKKITDITPTRGFCAEFGCATTVLLCSKLGLPISTTHTLVGSVVGVGLAKGIGALNLRILKEIALSWIVTLPFTAGMAMMIYLFFSSIF